MDISSQGFRSLEAAEKELQRYCMQPVILNGPANAHHVIPLNKTPNFKNVPDDCYVIVSDIYLAQLNGATYWDEEAQEEKPVEQIIPLKTFNKPTE